MKSLPFKRRKLNGQAGETQPAGNLENQSTEKP